MTVTDNGRGIPVDPHPKFKKKSALEVIMTTLHSGGKFDGKAYQTSGGLHGVGVSVVNALSDDLIVEVCRNRKMWRQSYALGKAAHKTGKRRPGAEQARHHDYVPPGPVDFRREGLIQTGATVPHGALQGLSCLAALKSAGNARRFSSAIKTKRRKRRHFKFERGLADYLLSLADGKPTVTDDMFTGKVERKEDGGHGNVEWAVIWGAAGFGDAGRFRPIHIATPIPTPEGGTHEAGLRAALTRGLKAYADLAGNKKAANVTAEDVMGTTGALLSVFVRNPEFQGQTKDKLATAEAQKAHGSSDPSGV